MYELRNQAALNFSTEQVRKSFRPGDHVKVIQGRFAGETGSVVRVDERDVAAGDLREWTACLVADNNPREVEVFVRDLTLSVEVSSGLEHALVLTATRQTRRNVEKRFIVLGQ